jgi:hypothetical protein
MWFALLRHAVTAIGAWLITHGYLSQEAAKSIDVEQVVGYAMTAGAVGASLYKEHRRRKPTFVGSGEMG